MSITYMRKQRKQKRRHPKRRKGVKPLKRRVRVFGGRVSKSQALLEKRGWKFGRGKEGGHWAKKGSKTIKAKCCFGRFLTRVQAAEATLFMK